MGRAFSENEKELIKKRLIETAKIAFEEMPYQSVKVESLAKKVGISKGAFYRFFPSKESLFLDVLIRIEQEIQKDIITKLTAHASLKEQLIDILFSTMMLFEKSYIFKAFSDVQIQTALLEKATDEQREQMLRADQQLLSMLVSETVGFKVPREVALDMMRSVFFIAPYKTQLESNFEVFMLSYITAIIEGIIIEGTPALMPKESEK
ncbi:TetR/AcrR family transcriptional regulator [Fusibacter bizertensis]